MTQALVATALLCALSLVYILVIPYFAPARLLTAFLSPDIREAAKHHIDPPFKMRLIGYVFTAVASAAFVGLIAWVGADGLRKGLGFWGLFGRCMILLYGYKLFDILVQDQYIVITRKYYVRFYPETRDCPSWSDRNFNTKNQLVQILAFPFACALTAWATLLIGGRL